MKIGRSIELDHNPCLNCGAPLDAAKGVGNDKKPRPGDISVCAYCGHIMAFDEQLKLRQLNDDEVRDVAGMKEVLTIQKVRRKVFETSKHWRS